MINGDKDCDSNNDSVFVTHTQLIRYGLLGMPILHAMQLQLCLCLSEARECKCTLALTAASQRFNACKHAEPWQWPYATVERLMSDLYANAVSTALSQRFQRGRLCIRSVPIRPEQR
eukprot:TRINITY_DN12618_c0_g1_i12.p1 TRINITY_DN12618_c0_g1~~TRINITY_DN12618_c0_g1_i12.p1  ORF type:complete len:117 (+),score=4.12 TRINITY_DN12618_c0_g1_i12:492-842(+)